MVLASYVPYDSSKDMTGTWIVGGVAIAVAAAVLLFFVYRIVRVIVEDEGGRRFIARSILFVVLLSIWLPFHIFGILVLLIVWLLLVNPSFRRADAMREIKKQIRERFDSENYSTGQYIPIYNPKSDELIATYDPETGMLTPEGKPGQIRINL
jgi:chromate transport protein ChrA